MAVYRITVTDAHDRVTAQTAIFARDDDEAVARAERKVAELDHYEMVVGWWLADKDNRVIYRMDENP